MRLASGAVRGDAMSTGLDRIELNKFAGFGGHPFHWPEGGSARYLRTGLVGFSVLLIAGSGAWLLLADGRGSVARSEPVHLAAAVSAPTPVIASIPPPYDPLTAEAIVPDQPTPLDRMKILRQSWRRGGLGSNAQVTFTLRNNNDYAVKDIEIECAFSRRNGSHLTDRSRLIPDTVKMRSRKTFIRMHVGFVNVNADKAKCSLVDARRI